ncbi:receptor-like protein kinase HSL1 [Diospyros lotus]|uniref:receptor-like protein kinase HSL1 n=1 Tax=Diospyros lotus TaxID=55363 RepID=UPI0022539815|nr:receptor-like protein kinase HSL1 [Diospyros lotus]
MYRLRIDIMTAMEALILLALISVSSLAVALNQEGSYLHRVKLGLSDPAGSLAAWNRRDATPCNWTGVACNPATGSVVSVDLSNSGLAGPFPTVLCRLASLSYLSLYNNFINSTLPLSISDCRSLTSLNLGQNLLSGSVPFTLADIPNLRVLILEGNSFSGEIPVSFGLFRRLESLNLANNFLNGTLPAVLGNITSLKVLRLAWNPFAPSRLAPELGNLTGLEELWLSNCDLIGPIPGSYRRLSRLSNFDVSDNMLTGSVPREILELTNLEQIELFNNSFSGPLPAGWSNLTKLRRFDASLNGLVGTIPDELCELPLESLNLCDNQLAGELPESITWSPNLYELKVFNNRLHGSLPSQLGKYSPLRTLDVSENQFSGQLPAGLCEKGVLKELLLIYNSFSGEIPSVLAQCRSLTRVRFRRNQFSGEVPAELWGLPHVYLLDLGENLFSGKISSMISGASNLSVLFISKNRFSGTIPTEIGSLNNLVEFSGSYNELSGQIPATIVNLVKLGRLNLRNNQLSGKIPLGIHSMKQLNDLNLANNDLSGEIPDEIGSFPVLNYLDLSQNLFSGKIPPSLQNLKLNLLNLSYNRLSGEIPPPFAKEIYRDSFLGNPGLSGDLPGLYPRSENRAVLWLLRSVIALAAMFFLAGVVWSVWNLRNLRESKGGITIMKWRSFHKLGFSEDEILDCLNEDDVIGAGSSGKVYKSVLRNGEVVAVKKLSDVAGDGSEKDAFDAEVETLGSIRHKNIVRLWCCCHAGDCKLLVYEYMPNGSLGSLLHVTKGCLLDWCTRFRIAVDAAEGLSYLHHDCFPPIVHRDVKSSNILLDSEFGAKIADFGLAKIVERVNKGAEAMSTIAGSCGYIAPEYAYTLWVNEKSDIYSFGVVLLELLSGRRAIDPEFGEKDLVTWVRSSLHWKGIDYVLDPSLDLVFKEQIYRVLDIGLLCVRQLPADRPSMRRVVKMLHEAGTSYEPREATVDGKLSGYHHEHEHVPDEGSDS